MEFLAEYGLFAAKLATLVVAVLLLVGGIVSLTRNARAGAPSPGEITVRRLNDDYDRAALTFQATMLPRKAFKSLAKKYGKKQKARKSESSRRIFVVDFHGDIRASALTALRQEITAVLTTAGEDDEVVVRLESGGGLVHAYGLAASQLLRIRDRGIRLTVAVDKVAASGGYLMASVGDRILAAPFAILGSIGVIAQLPNFNRLLKRHDVDYEQFMAGEHKRTVTLFGENTDEGREKFQHEIEEVHTLFKDFIKTHRPQLDLADVATGEHWYGTHALDHQLIDQLITSDDYLLGASTEADIYHVAYTGRKPLLARLMSRSAEALLHAGAK